MTEYEIERYNKISQNLEKGIIDDLIEEVDYPIIIKTDLKDRIIKKIIEDKLDDKYDVYTILEVLSNIASDEEIIDNQELLQKIIIKDIDEGNLYGQMLDYLKDKNYVNNYFLEKIKDPKYIIKEVPKELLDNERFINYCLQNKNLSIFNFIIMDEKYIDKVRELIKEGYGFNCSDLLYLDDYCDELIISLLENGYISDVKNYVTGNAFGIEYSKDEQLVREERIVNIIKSLIDRNMEIHIARDTNGYVIRDFEIPRYKEIFEYILDNKKYEYLEVFKTQNLSSDMTPELYNKIKSAIMEHPSLYNVIFYTTIKKYDQELIDFLLDNNNLSVIDYYLTYKEFLDHKEKLKEKLKEGHILPLNNIVLEMILESNDQELLELVINNNESNIFNIMSHINHHERLVSNYNKEFYDIVREKISKIYNLNLEHLDKFVERFGYEYLYYLENNNMKKAINSNDETFNKYLQLFNISKLTINDARNIYDAILQVRFKPTHEHDIGRFVRIKTALLTKDMPIPIEDLKVLAENMNISRIVNLTEDQLIELMNLEKTIRDNSDKKLDKEEIKKLAKQKLKELNIFNPEHLRQLSNSPIEFLLNISKELKNKSNEESNLTMLYIINKLYLKDLREQFRAENGNNYIHELKLLTMEDPDSLKNYQVNEIIRILCNYSIPKPQPKGFKELPRLRNEQDSARIYDETFKMFENLQYNISNEFTNTELLKEFIKFMRNPQNSNKKIKPYIKNIKEIIGNNQELTSLISSRDDKIKIIYQLPAYDSKSIFDILGEINIDELSKTVFNNENIFKELKQTLDKYKFVYWESIFNIALEKSNIEFESYDIATFITKFKEIYEHLSNNNTEDIGLTSMMNYANVLSSSSSRYKVLFGEEDHKLIKLNPKPNNAPIRNHRDERLEIGVKNILTLYNKQHITVKPIDKIIDVGDKKIKVNLGNFTNPINLTYGERTGACMRIGGAGESLYNFCQTNPNAFHIRLTDPETGEFISRVSGFRNGNSIFLNELRTSEHKSYSNEDVINATRQIASILLEESKTSKRKIENVFITPYYAMENYPGKRIKIVEDIKEGLPNFYFDLNSEGICLATTATDREYVPINTSKEDIEEYPVIRDIVQMYDDPKEIQEKINRFRLLKDIITEQNPEKIEETELTSLDDYDKIVQLITGEDFIAYLDKDMNIHTDYIERNDPRCHQELSSSVQLLNKKKEAYQNETRKGHSK